MEQTAEGLIFQFIALVMTGVLTLIGTYAKKYIATKIELEKYGFENERVERIIDNAIAFAEQKGIEYAKAQSAKLESSKKLDYARKYIDSIDRGIIEKYGEQLNGMITRKVIQTIGMKQSQYKG